MKQFNTNHAYSRATGFSILPQQALPSKKKNKKWIEATADALEREALKQVRKNLKFVDYYKSVEGELTDLELRDLIPQLREVVDLREELHIPSFLKNYDLLGIIVKTFVGWMTGSEDKYFVVGLDDYEMNEFIYDKTYLLHNSVVEQWNMVLNRRLIQMGLDPNLRDFSSEEEAAAYIEQVNQTKMSITPAEIQRWMTEDWRSVGVQWGQHTYELDKQRFDLPELDADACYDMMVSGKWFRHTLVGYDYYKPESWSPIEVFHDESPGLKYPQYGNYIGRLNYMSPSALISRYGQMLTAKEKQRLIGGDEDWEGTWNAGGQKEDDKPRKPSLLNWYKNEQIPFEGYHDYKSILEIQNMTGQPSGEVHYIGEDGQEKVMPRFLPDMQFNPSSFRYDLFNKMYGDDVSRNGLLQVMEAYWVSWKKVYFITYESESGLILQQLVTDDLMTDFFKENNISKKDITLAKASDDPKINTYIVEYIPEVRHVVKVSGGDYMEEPLYLDGEPIVYQVKGDGNMYDFQLPVTGFIGPSPIERAMPWQAAYNYSLNKLRNLEEKEIGKFALFDVNLLPSEFSNWGDVGESFNALMNIAKTTGLLGTDMSRNNTAQSGGTPFNQFAQYDLSFTQNMAQCVQNAMFYRSMALETFGITQQVLGTPQKYSTAEGIRQGMDATMIQVQEYFNHLDWSKKKSINTHLAIAQMCQKSGKDQTFFYTNSDLKKQYVSLSDIEDVPLRHLGVMAISDSATRKKVEGLKAQLAQLNFAGDDILSWVKLYNSSSIQELVSAGIEARRRQDELMQRQSEQQQQLQAQQQQFMVDDREDRQAHEIQKEETRGIYNVERERVRAAGVAAGKDSNAESLQFVQNQAKLALDQAKAESEANYKEALIDGQQKRDQEAMRIKQKELEQRDRELDLKNKQIDNDRFTSVINKN